MATIPSNKRQRIAEQSLNISNLPDGILCYVASYLAQPSRALFAVAMTSPSKSWTKDNFTTDSKHQQTIASILSSGTWDTLDFEDIEKSLTEKLTDDDVHAVLKCISAQDVLKKLKLTGCINITGRGLQVLRGSAVIEYIDLSLVKQFESPKLDPEPMISEADVIPILDSIVSANSNSLKMISDDYVLDSIVSEDNNSLQMIVFPKKWREAKTNELTQFLINYNQLLESRKPSCSRCDRDLPGENEMVVYKDDDHFYGTQSYCCYKCFAHCCYECVEEVDGLSCCDTCEREYCEDCVAFKGECCKGCWDCVPDVSNSKVVLGTIASQQND